MCTSESFERQHSTFTNKEVSVCVYVFSFPLALSALMLGKSIFWMDAQNYIIRLQLRRSNKIVLQQQQRIEQQRGLWARKIYNYFMTRLKVGKSYQSEDSLCKQCLSVCMHFRNSKEEILSLCAFVLLVTRSEWHSSVLHKILGVCLGVLAALHFTKIFFLFKLTVKIYCVNPNRVLNCNRCQRD